ncbi:helix-turn-helix domain-containing protein [Tahibacter amnicola]|uniref:AraC family transcriptional regulator n=1 Tax=Tahibacter amnicola TaxID=2976241 RepID=A0ABY6BLD4_9GAMM|nr:AraC family transcriptional regulator [Tahibacter amnicola]UXI69386.1 AraC family transcriptional regulator [Tahibacter amnicola]
MKIFSETLRVGARIEWPGETFAQRFGDGLAVAVGAGRGATIACQGVGGIWIPLRGRLKVASGETSFALEPGQLMVSEPEQRIQAGGRSGVLWLALLAQRNGWRRALSRAGAVSLSETALVPAWHGAPPALRRLAVGVVRQALSRTSDYPLQSACDRFLAEILELQSGFDAMVERCPGRTLAQRRNVFLRLQRVRNHMAANCEQELDVPELARMASYSPWHFIRAFHAVYGETPHACLVDRRLERARRLVRASALAISEIAVASGFENRCAFSRLFKQRFGISAAALRRSHGISARKQRLQRCDAGELTLHAVSATRSANWRQLAGATDF